MRDRITQITKLQQDLQKAEDNAWENLEAAVVLNSM